MVGRESAVYLHKVVGYDARGGLVGDGVATDAIDGALHRIALFDGFGGSLPVARKDGQLGLALTFREVATQLISALEGPSHIFSSRCFGRFWVAEVAAFALIEGVVSHQIRIFRVRCAWDDGHQILDFCGGEGLVPDAQLVDFSFVIVAAALVGSQDYVFQCDGLGFGGSAGPEGAVDIDRHAAGAAIFHENPVVPVAFVFGRCGGFVDAIVSASHKSTIEIDAAIRPWEMDV